MSKVAFLSRGDITDCLRAGWNSPEFNERLTILVIVGTSMDAHCFRRQVGIGSESDCLLGQPRRIFEISASEAGWKVEKSGGDVDGEGECRRWKVVADDEVRDR